MVEENGWCILNGNMEKDEKVEWMYMGSRGNSIIDYAVVSAITKKDIAEFKVKERVESDHMPIKVKVETAQERELRVEKETWKELRIWIEKATQRYREEAEKIEFKEENINEMMKEISEKLNKAVRKRKVREWKIGCSKWWDQECAKKQEARKALRKWKRGNGQKAEYIQKKKQYKDECEKKERVPGNRRKRNLTNQERRIGMEVHKQRKKKKRTNNKEV